MRKIPMARETVFRSRQGGVALAIVVWFIAGMALLVAGIVAQARIDVRWAQVHLFRAQAEAAGDGAIRLLLADLVAGGLAGDAPSQRGLPGGVYQLGPWDVSVLALPAAALVELNSAPLPQLALLFSQDEQLARADARALAVNVVKWRADAGGAAPGSSGFEVVEDLLRVDGMTRTRLDAVRHMVTVSTRPSAPPRGTARFFEQLASLRPGAWLDPAAIETDALPGARTAGAARAAPAFRIDAIVVLGGRQWLRRLWVSMQTPRNSALPWRVDRVESARVVGLAS